MISMGSNARTLGDSSSHSKSSASVASPIEQFLFFHKVIRASLERLCSDAHSAEKGGENDLALLQRRFELFRLIYAQYSYAEDEVLFPALDSRVKNIAPTYSLEHKEENGLFDSMSKLLNSAQTERSASLSKRLKREVRCCAKAIQTCLCKHMAKEEAQVFPLLLKHFNIDEQAALVWQFLFRIPVNLLQSLLPWIAASLSEVVLASMASCMRAVSPRDELLPHVVLTWLSVASMQKIQDVDIMQIVHNPHLIKRESSSLRKGGKRSAHTLDSDGTAIEGCSKLPVSFLTFWHTSLGKEFMNFAESARRLQVSEVDSVEKMSSISKRLTFLMEIRKFYSAAEDNILSPVILERAGHAPSFVAEHIEEELEFRKFESFLEGMHDVDSIMVGGVVEASCNRAACIAQDVERHLRDEAAVFPLVQKYFNVQEQQALSYDCLRMLPLKIMQKMLPWLGSLLREKDIDDMCQNLKQGVNEEPFANLLIGWVNGGKNEYLAEDELLCHPVFGTVDERSVRRKFSCDWDTISAHNHLHVTSADPQQTSIALGPGYSGNAIDAGAECFPSLACCSVSTCSSCYHGSCLFGGHSMAESKNEGASFKPIDCIFQFHKAIQRDLEYLDQESEKIADCDDEFLRQFTRRFMMLWSLYRAHSNAEDDIVFPALEAREALHNVSHSYVIDHEKEEQLFKDISNVLTQLSDLHAELVKQGAYNLETDEGQFYSTDWKDASTQRLDLSVKLQGMCKSMQVSLNLHIYREERELWPLFSTHFSVQEQEKIVGRIIGTTGAEVLQSMIPWVTAALSLEEQSNMFDTWLLAARNTMFDQWLGAFFPSSPIQSPRILTIPTELSQSAPLHQDNLPQTGNSDCLRMLAEYLTKDSFSGGSDKRADESVECIMGTDVDSCDSSLLDEKKREETELEHSSDLSACHQNNDMDQNHSCLNEKILPHGQDNQGTSDFKAGWQNIFRMNQKELEAAVRKVSNDDSLDPRKRAYLMQNLMTSRWIVAQQRASSGPKDGKDVPGCKPSFHDQEMKIFGCEHYKRNCKLLASCCGLVFTCRFCHDNVSDHLMDRQATKEMMCMRCLKIQPVAQHCSTPSCNNFLMARYYCSICKFFDDDIKDIYHCPYCNICRVGKGLGIDFFHCMTCNACMNVSLKTHKCREKGLESNCPICHDFMFTSKAPVKALSCGHFMHSACFQAFTSYHYTCPICCKSVGDMSVYFGMLDGLLAGEDLPEEFKGRKQEILCNDCEQKGIAPFHWLHHKCVKCGSYNTRVL